MITFDSDQFDYGQFDHIWFYHNQFDNNPYFNLITIPISIYNLNYFNQFENLILSITFENYQSDQK